MKQQKNRGFSLIELMVVIGIISILAALAYPSYTDYLIKGRLTEARSNLSQMRVKLEQYFQDNRTYVGACTNNTVAPLPTDGVYFSYGCDLAANPPTYTVTATGQNAMTGFTLTINQDNLRATTAAPSGWPTNAACWIKDKGGSC